MTKWGDKQRLNSALDRLGFASRSARVQLEIFFSVLDSLEDDIPVTVWNKLKIGEAVARIQGEGEPLLSLLDHIHDQTSKHER